MKKDRSVMQTLFFEQAGKNNSLSGAAFFLGAAWCLRGSATYLE